MYSIINFEISNQYFMLNVRWIKLNSVLDDRGRLTSIEGDFDIPFSIQRIFYMHDISKGSERGGHAHMETDQLAVAVHGSVNIILGDGKESVMVELNDPTWGIFLPRMTWTRLYNFSDNGVCMVLANTHYEIKKSIRSWSEYLSYLEYNSVTEPISAPILKKPSL